MTEGDAGIAVCDACLMINLIGHLRIGDKHEVLDIGIVETNLERVLWHDGHERVLPDGFFLPVDDELAFTVRYIEGKPLIYLCGYGIAELLEGIDAVECVEQKQVVLDAC
jgi:hypothetical protein